MAPRRKLNKNILLMDKQIIDFVKEHQFVYDRSHENFNNNIYKEDKWKQLADSLDEPVELIKKRWKTLKDRYFRLMKNGGVENYKYCHDLNFLGPYEPRRRSIIRCKKEENYEDNSQMDESMDSSHSPVDPVDNDMFENNYTLSITSLATEDAKPTKLENHSIVCEEVDEIALEDVLQMQPKKRYADTYAESKPTKLENESVVCEEVDEIALEDVLQLQPKKRFKPSSLGDTAISHFMHSLALQIEGANLSASRLITLQLKLLQVVGEEIRN
uniref:MADF domain-containing protein n=1 Tax=Glossina pallidipes TaxID=7398 RepID=A0A1A9ZIN7_GLOPL